MLVVRVCCAASLDAVLYLCSYPQDNHVPVGQPGVGPRGQVMIAGIPPPGPPPGRSRMETPHNIPVAHPRKTSESFAALQPPRDEGWVAPGEVVNENRPQEACPICGRQDFPTVTDLEIHSARCN